MMVRRIRLTHAALAAAVILAASCAAPGSYSATEVADAAKDLRMLVPAIEAGLALVVPDDPTSRALDPTTALETAGVDNPWPYADTDTPDDVYLGVGGTGGTVRLPASGYYQTTAGDQLYFTLTPETALGATFYRVILYTYPAFDLVVAHTIEEYIVNAVPTDAIWAWGNRDATGAASGWVSLTTVYVDGTTGSRTVEWVSTDDDTYYEAFAVNDPVPTDTATFAGYRYEELDTPPASGAGTENYSSHVTETVTGKGTVVDAVQFYTETTMTTHSGLTYVRKDKKKKWSEDIQIVTRMEEDTTTGTKTIRSVGEVGTSQYYIDKVDISRAAGDPITYTSTHDVYDTALPRAGDANAKDYVSLSLVEDGPDTGIFTGTLEETKGYNKILHNVTIERDRHYRFAMNLTFQSSTPRALAEELAIPITQQDLSSLSIELPSIEGTFNGYYEAGSLFGTVTAGDAVYDVVVAEEGVAVDDRLFAY